MNHIFLHYSRLCKFFFHLLQYPNQIITLRHTIHNVQHSLDNNIVFIDGYIKCNISFGALLKNQKPVMLLVSKKRVLDFKKDKLRRELKTLLLNLTKELNEENNYIYN